MDSVFNSTSGAFENWTVTRKHFITIWKTLNILYHFPYIYFICGIGQISLPIYMSFD